MRQHPSSSIPVSACGSLLLVFGLTLVSCVKESGPDTVTFELEENATRGPLEIFLRLQKKEITLAELNHVEVEAKIDQGYDVKFPELLDGFDGVIVRDFDEMPVSIGSDGKKSYRRLYEVEPVFSGEAEITPFEIRFVKAAVKEGDEPAIDADSEGSKEFVLETPRVAFQVTSLADAGQALPDIRGLKDPAELPAPDRRPLFLYGGLGLLTIGLLFFLVYRLRRRPREKSRVVVPPHVIAYRELERLREERLVEKGQLEEFTVRLSAILRRYIEGRFGLRAPERTTEEFLQELAGFRQESVLTDGHRKALEGFLVHTDLVKFAALDPSTDDIQRSFDLIRSFIEETREDRRAEAA